MASGCFLGSRSLFRCNSPENKFVLKPDALPTRVRLEACNDCQLNCAECWIRKDEQEIIEKAGGFGYLKFNDFKNFIDKHSFIKEIELSNNGEIFLNPELNDIIKYAFKKSIELTAYNGVNLNTLSEKTAKNLVKYRFNGLTVSIDGATPETYKIYRRGGDFNTVINNIKTINKYKEIYDTDSPHLVWQFILFGHNEHEIDLAKKLANELNMDIVFVKNIVEGYSPLKNPKIVQEKTGVNLVDENQNSSLNEKESQEENRNDIFCYQLEDSPQINFNGDLLGCCCPATITMKTNVFKVGLLNALNSPNVLKAKLALSDLNVAMVSNIPCTDCDIYKHIKDLNKPLTFKIS